MNYKRTSKLTNVTPCNQMMIMFYMLILTCHNSNNSNVIIPLIAVNNTSVFSTIRLCVLVFFIRENDMETTISYL